MPETCRTCEFACWNRECGRKWAYDPIRKVCDNHKPCETPLLVDALAEALYWLLNLHHGVSKGGPGYEVVGREWDEALQAGMQAHTRYQKEVGGV